MPYCHFVRARNTYLQPATKPLNPMAEAEQQILSMERWRQRHGSTPLPRPGLSG